VAVKIVMADDPHIPTFTLRLHVRDRHGASFLRFVEVTPAFGSAHGSLILPNSPSQLFRMYWPNLDSMVISRVRKIINGR
jgi:hypothetical protein